MSYTVVFKPRALKDLKDLPKSETSCIMPKIEGLRKVLLVMSKSSLLSHRNIGCELAITACCLKSKVGEW